MGELSKLPNIGPEVERQLILVGITTAEQLRQVGSRAAWLRIKEIDPSACIHRLYGLEGAVEGVRKNLLDQQVKDALKQFYNENKAK